MKHLRKSCEFIQHIALLRVHSNNTWQFFGYFLTFSFIQITSFFWAIYSSKWEIIDQKGAKNVTWHFDDTIANPFFPRPPPAAPIKCHVLFEWPLAQLAGKKWCMCKHTFSWWTPTNPKYPCHGYYFAMTRHNFGSSN